MSWERRFVRLLFGILVLACVAVVVIVAFSVNRWANWWTFSVLGTLALAYVIGWLFDWKGDPERDGLGGRL